MLASFRSHWRTTFFYAVLILLLTVGLGVYLSAQLNRLYATDMALLEQEQTSRLAADRRIIGLWPLFSEDVPISWQQPLAILLRERGELLAMRLSAFSPTGMLMADSHLTSAEHVDDATLLPNPAPLQSAGITLYDNVLQSNISAYYFPITVNNVWVGTLRVHVPTTAQPLLSRSLYGLVLPATITVALLIIALMVYQIERMNGTIRRLTTAAKQITAGDLSARTLSISGGEIGQFVRAFNRMADKLQRQMSKRAREKDRLHTVLHTMTDGVLLLNRHSSIRLLNDAAAEILHTSAEQALKRSFVQTVRDHRFVEVFRRCQRSGKTETAILEFEADSVVRMVVTPFLRGKDRGHLVVLQDLSRMHQLQMARRDFVSNISHELRTPLASLRALVETLTDGALDDKVAAYRFLHHMEVEVDALTQMVQELLELSRIESGNAKLDLTSVSIAKLLVHSSERLRAQAQRADVAIQVDLTGSLPTVLVDLGRIEQVITNLIHNAIKFTPSGGLIRISAEQSSTDKITVSVADSGVGIAHEELTRIFERFYKADRARSGGGTGLGLAIAKHIVQAHDGTIWAESRPGHGSTFYFTLSIEPSMTTTVVPTTMPVDPIGDVNADTTCDALHPLPAHEPTW